MNNDTLDAMNEKLTRLERNYAGHVEDDKAAFAALATSLQSLARKFDENTAATIATQSDVRDIRTLLQIGRGVAMFARAVRWVVVWTTPIAIFIAGGYAFWQWLVGKGPFPH